MPQIPVFENTIAAPLSAPMPTANAEAFEAPARALEQTGAQVQQVGSDWGSIYAAAKRQQDATVLTAQGMGQLADAQFRWSKTDDSDAALAGYKAEAAAITKATLAQTSDPEVGAYVQRSLTTQSIIGAENTRNAAFGLQASKYRGQLDTTLAGYAQGAALATDDFQRAHYVDLANQAITGATSAHWLAPQEASDRTIAFTSQVAEVKARLLIANDPIAAASVLEDPAKAAAAFPGLLPEKAASMAGEAVWRAMRVEQRNNAAQAHNDAMAGLALRQFQSQNETNVLADVYAGKPVDMNNVMTMAHNGMITPGGLDTIHSAVVQGNAGTNDTQAVLGLYQHLGQRTLTADDIHAAVAGRLVSGNTALELMRSINQQGTVANKAAYDAGLQTVRTAFSASAVERGIFGTPDKAPEAALLAAVQAEYFNRTLVQHQDPQAVAADLVGRYQQVPSGISQPRLGTVSTQADLDGVAAATYRAHAAGQIDDATYQDQVLILNRLKALLTLRGGAPLPRLTPLQRAGGANPALNAVQPPQ